MSILKSVIEDSILRFLANHEASDKVQVWDFNIIEAKKNFFFFFKQKGLEGDRKMYAVL